MTPKNSPYWVVKEHWYIPDCPTKKEFEILRYTALSTGEVHVVVEHLSPHSDVSIGYNGISRVVINQLGAMAHDRIVSYTEVLLALRELVKLRKI